MVPVCSLPSAPPSTAPSFHTDAQMSIEAICLLFAPPGTLADRTALVRIYTKAGLTALTWAKFQGRTTRTNSMRHLLLTVTKHIQLQGLENSSTAIALCRAVVCCTGWRLVPENDSQSPRGSTPQQLTSPGQWVPISSLHLPDMQSLWHPGCTHVNSAPECPHLQPAPGIQIHVNACVRSFSLPTDESSILSHLGDEVNVKAKTCLYAYLDFATRNPYQVSRLLLETLQ
jgi:hypothetical protein